MVFPVIQLYLAEAGEKNELTETRMERVLARNKRAIIKPHAARLLRASTRSMRVSVDPDFSSHWIRTPTPTPT